MCIKTHMGWPAIASSPLPPLTRLVSPVLVLGPAHAGKSEAAIQMLAPDRNACVIGMGHAANKWMAQRHAALRALRPPGWSLIEGQADLAGALHEAVGSAEQILVDSLSQWIGALVHELGASIEPHEADAQVIPRINEVIAIVAGAAKTHRLILTSTEAGASPPPSRVQDWCFRRLVGLANQKLAACCETVVLMTAGLPQLIKHKGS